MKITLVHDRPIESLKLSRSGEDRSPGLHLSTIIHSIMEDMDPKTYKNSEPMDMNRVEAGFSWEVVLERAFVERMTDVVRIGECEKDGIALSPDGLDAGDPPTLFEFKLTWKSSRETPTPCDLHKQDYVDDTGRRRWRGEPHPDCRMCVHEFGPKFYPWILQMMGYCHVLNITRAQLFAFFVNGDYKHGFAPECRPWAFEWTERELQTNWAYMLRQARSKGLLPKEAA